MQTLKGFRDFIGINSRERNWLMGIFRTIFEQQGFEPLETPSLEYEELLLGKYGAEADKLLYAFEDRGGRRVALRYDQTVPTARVVAQYKNNLTFPFKRYQIQPVWRADKPQKGRYREFYQCDIDIIGAHAPVADAQLLATVSSVFSKLEVPFKIKYNDRPSLIELIRSNGVPEDKTVSVIQTLDKLDKKSSNEVIAELREKEIDVKICQKLFEGINEAKIPENLNAITALAKNLGVSGDSLEFAPALARGLDYYTGMIFEVVIPGYSGGSVAGGGRYDKLLATLINEDIPATGLAFGFDRLIDALRELDKFPKNLARGSKALVTIFNEDTTDYSASIYRMLQKIDVASEIYPEIGKKLESQIKYALAKKIPYVIIAGPDEKNQKMVKLKNLTKKTQEDLNIPELLERMKSDNISTLGT